MDEQLENIRRAAQRGLQAALRRQDSEGVDTFQHILNLYGEVLAARRQELSNMDKV